MNPVTVMLLDRVDWPELEAWIRRWDRLEFLYLTVYRRGSAARRQRREYRRLRRELRSGYELWRDQLREHWCTAEVDGRRLDEDPFEKLTRHAILSADRIDWRDLQTLPAAREALNSFLLEVAKGRGGED
jgi:hypothetical protein